MFRQTFRTAVFALTFLISTMGLGQVVMAGSIEVHHPQVIAPAKTAPVAAGYMTLENPTSSPVILVGVNSDISRKSQIHSTAMDAGIMKMRRVKTGVEIPAGEAVEFTPGGYHIMFMGLKAPLEKGDTHTVTLTFSNGESQKVGFVVGDAKSGHGHGTEHD